MTITAIRKQLNPYKRVSEKQLRRYLVKFKIKPVGIRQRPQIYPASSAFIIINKLGLNGNGKALR